MHPRRRRIRWGGGIGGKGHIGREIGRRAARGVLPLDRKAQAALNPVTLPDQNDIIRVCVGAGGDSHVSPHQVSHGRFCSLELSTAHLTQQPGCRQIHVGAKKMGRLPITDGWTWLIREKTY